MPLYGKASYTNRYINYFSTEAPNTIKLLLFDADRQLEYSARDLSGNITVDKVLMDGSPGTFAKSTNEMLSKVDTEFVMMNDNDDFPNFPGILKAIELFQSDSSIEWVGGKIGHFFGSALDRTVFLRDKTGRGSRTVREKLTGRYQQEWYTIFRTSSLIRIFKEMIQSSPVEWKHPEIFQSLYCSLLHGKYSEEYIYFRQIFVRSSSDSLNKKAGLHEDFVRNTVEAICTNGGGSQDRAEIERLLKGWLAQYNDRRKMYVKLFLEGVLFHLGILKFLDRKLAGHSESLEMEFLRASQLIGKYCASVKT